MDRSPIWMTVILKTIFGSFAGTLAGLGMGTAAIYLATYLFTTNAPPSRTCSDSLSFGMVVMGLIAIRIALGIVGFVVGTIVGWILSVHQARKHALSY